jgi:hypothetical protein
MLEALFPTFSSFYDNVQVGVARSSQESSMASGYNAVLLTLVVAGAWALPGCSAINPLCGSSRPVPVLTSISPTTVTEADVLGTFILNIKGSNFVSSSVVVINKAQIASDVTSATTIKASVGPATLKSAGIYNVWVNTPAGNSGDLGCDSGGSSSQTTLTVE